MRWIFAALVAAFCGFWFAQISLAAGFFAALLGGVVFLLLSRDAL